MQKLKYLCGLLLALTSLQVLSQERSTRKTVTVYVTKLSQSNAMLNDFITKYEGISHRTDLSTNRYYCEFLLSKEHMGKLDSLASKMGYVTQSSFNTENTQERITNLEDRLATLKYENELYERQLQDTSLNVNTNRYDDDLRNKIRNNEHEIMTSEISLSRLRQDVKDKMCFVQFTINDEMSTPNNSRVSFVNMPGIEYGFLQIENQKTGVSARAYQGVTIKYMFTRGKSYFDLGVYRALDNNTTDSTLINELFMINFGQDFYPRHFGRGKRKFLNLYTGYQIGGFITNRNNDKNSVFVPNANLAVGVELLKTKHVLIDNKVSYFLPLDELNRNMRGILYQASFNFVF